MATALVVVGVLAAATLLWRLQVAHVRRVRGDRRALYADVLPVLDGAVVHDNGLGYPALTGTFRGHRMRLEPVVDTLTLRKLPALWLLVTQERRLDVRTPVDVLLRPTGGEFFSPNAEYAHDLAAPDWLPRPARIASPAPTPVPPPLEHLAPLLQEPATKEVLVGPAGIRVVRRLTEGAQGPYRATRRAAFEPLRLRPDGLRLLLDTLTEVADGLAADEARTR